MVSDTGDIRGTYMSNQVGSQNMNAVNGQMANCGLTMTSKVTWGWKGRSMRAWSDKVINMLASWSCMM